MNRATRTRCIKTSIPPPSAPSAQLRGNQLDELIMSEVDQEAGTTHAFRSPDHASALLGGDGDWFRDGGLPDGGAEVGAAEGQGALVGDQVDVSGG